MSEELAIIKDINIGMRDCNRPVIWFTTETIRGCALQIEYDIVSFIKNSGCYKLSDLEGKPCVVEYADNLVKFIRVHK